MFDISQPLKLFETSYILGVVIVMLSLLSLLALLIIFKYLRSFWLIKQWHKITGQISSMDLKGAQAYSGSIGYILRRVLTDRPGVARLQGVNSTLDYLGNELEAPLRSLRSFSYLAILFGLFGTVLVLATELSKINSITQLGLQQIRQIYPINAIAILVAVIVFMLFLFCRWVGDQVFLEASQALDKLEVDTPIIGQAQLAAFEAMERSIREWGNRVNDLHLQQTERLMNEVKNLGEAFRVMVNDLILARQEEDQTLLPILQAQEARTELLSQRVDHGFAKLAAPFEQSIPAMKRLTTAASNLETAAQTLAEADVPGAVALMVSEIRNMAQAVAMIPEGVRQSLVGLPDSVADATHCAIRDSFQEVVGGQIAEVKEVLASLRQTGRSLQNTIGVLPENIGHGLRTLTEEVATAVGKSVRQGMAKATEARIAELTEALRALAAGAAALQATAAAIPAAVGKGISDAGATVSDATAEAARRGLQEVAGPMVQEIKTSVTSLTDAGDFFWQTLDKLKAAIKESGEGLRSEVGEVRKAATGLDRAGQEIIKQVQRETGKYASQMAAMEKALQNLQSSAQSLAAAQQGGQVQRDRSLGSRAIHALRPDEGGRAPRADTQPSKTLGVEDPSVEYEIPPPGGMPEAEQPNPPSSAAPDSARSGPNPGMRTPPKPAPKRKPITWHSDQTTRKPDQVSPFPEPPPPEKKRGLISRVSKLLRISRKGS